VRLVAVNNARADARRTLEMATGQFKGGSAATLTQVYPPPAPDESWTPVRAPTLHSDWATPLAQAMTTGAIVFVGGTALAYASGIPKPMMWSSGAGFITLAISWRNGLNWTRNLIHKVEKHIGRDIDGDKVIGKPQPDIISPIPVYAPGSNRPDTNGIKIRLRPSARTIDRDKLCEYLQWALVNGWTRDKAQSFGIGQKEWPDVRAFVDRWGLWGTKDHPALEGYIANLRRQ
jgi:hypothetical protein